VFVSFSRSDSAYVDALAEHLSSQGVPVTVVRDRITSDEHWALAVRHLVDASAGIVVVMTPAAEESAWARREIERARSVGKPVFPLLLEGDVHVGLATLHHDDVRGGLMPPDALITRLRALQANPPAPVPTPAAPGRQDIGPATPFGGGVPSTASAWGAITPATTAQHPVSALIPTEPLATTPAKSRLLVTAAVIALLAGIVMAWPSPGQTFLALYWIIDKIDGIALVVAAAAALRTRGTTAVGVLFGLLTWNLGTLFEFVSVITVGPSALSALGPSGAVGPQADDLFDFFNDWHRVIYWPWWGSLLVLAAWICLTIVLVRKRRQRRLLDSRRWLSPLAAVCAVAVLFVQQVDYYDYYYYYYRYYDYYSASAVIVIYGGWALIAAILLIGLYLTVLADTRDYLTGPVLAGWTLGGLTIVIVSAASYLFDMYVLGPIWLYTPTLILSGVVTLLAWRQARRAPAL
jgi:hypothetical protein